MRSQATEGVRRASPGLKPLGSQWGAVHPHPPSLTLEGQPGVHALPLTGDGSGDGAELD